MVSWTQLEAKRGKAPKLLMWQSRWQCVAAVQLLLQLSDMLISRLHDSSLLPRHCQNANFHIGQPLRRGKAWKMENDAGFVELGNL